MAVWTTSADSLVVSIDGGSHRYSYYALSTVDVGNTESVRPAVVTLDVVDSNAFCLCHVQLVCYKL